jgi:hypothetical protein
MLKTVGLNLKGALLAYKNAFNVARHFAKDIFRTTTRIFLVRHNILKIMLFTPRTQEHLKTSTLDLRYKCLTLFTLIS